VGVDRFRAGPIFCCWKPRRMCRRRPGSVVLTLLLVVVSSLGLRIPIPRLSFRKSPPEHPPSPPPTKPLFEPSVPVAINGGDPWIGWRVTSKELNELVEAATSTIRGRPVMKQFHPRRSWLWQQWQGTIVRSVVLNEVRINLVWAFCAVGFVWHLLPRLLPGDLAGARVAVLASLKPMENFWALTQTLVAFVLSFFLSQTYSVWRDAYSIARKVQGRLSDQGLILATNAEREEGFPGRPYTRRAVETIETWARYARLFNMLFFASVTRRFAPLATPKGLQALQAQGAITQDEVERLISTTSWHQTVALWMATLVTTAIDDGRVRGGASVAYQSNVNTANLRSHYAQMADKLSGRMPLAYTHLVQLFVDTLCFAAPLALVGPLGAVGAVVGTMFITVFYAGVLALAKMFLDPFDNEDYGGRSGIRLEADTLIQEVNALTRRWTSAARSGMPNAVYAPPEMERYKNHPEPLLQQPSTAPANANRDNTNATKVTDQDIDDEFKATAATKKRKDLSGQDGDVVDANYEEAKDDDDESESESESSSPLFLESPSSAAAADREEERNATSKPKKFGKTRSYSVYRQPFIDQRRDYPDVDDVATALRAVPANDYAFFEDDFYGDAPPFLQDTNSSPYASSTPTVATMTKPSPSSQTPPLEEEDDDDDYLENAVHGGGTPQTVISIKFQLFPPRVNTTVARQKKTRTQRRRVGSLLRPGEIALLNRRARSSDKSENQTREV